jgi:hypothetical protein
MSLNWDLDAAPPASSAAQPSTPTGKFSSLTLGAGGGGISGGAQLTLLKFADCVQGEEIYVRTSKGATSERFAWRRTAQSRRIGTQEARSG